jgi:putative alpha-1,2-mannosidase
LIQWISNNIAKRVAGYIYVRNSNIPHNPKWLFGATLHFENGKSLTIDAPDNSPENMYIESLKVNGVDYSRNYLTHGDLLNGGTLRFDMGSQPNMKRGTQPEDYPYSFSNELKK